MRVLVKGGVWKNTEDEILKAAVMKYGKNQWARISSLLVRKSAKQCKARWYEWLDPSIKKTEWSREEEEKLLHLAKIMPNQWRTIAPLVGRTAHQCLEHYERLLDRAQGKDELDPDDPRRLRPGEIDPAPETKPAKPDPIDMDEDEKEMLSEARARLANTKGKKAKRKAREKQLEEARRLAALQKRRELKAAGIEVGRLRRRVRGIDYNAEIPFEKRPAPGFYDTSDEVAPPPPRGLPPRQQQQLLEGPSRQAEEEQARKRDREKQKRREERNLPAAIMQLNKLTEPEQVRKRQKLQMPEPQIKDRDLEQLAKALPSAAPADAAGAASSRATSTLLARYDLPTPGSAARTPAPAALALRTPARPDTLLSEARSLAQLSAQQTPLIGGANPDMPPPPARPPRGPQAPPATPNPLALVQQKSLATPARDQLGLNEAAESARALRQRLQSGLASLPAPKNEYQIVLPEEMGEDAAREGPGRAAEDEEEAVEPDTRDVEARQREEARKREEARFLQRSTVLRRGLPRPLALQASLLEDPPVPARVATTEAEEDAELRARATEAERLVRQEMYSVILHDAAEYPVPGAPSRVIIDRPYERLPEQLLDQAADLLRRELEATAPPASQRQVPAEAWETDLVLLVGEGRYASREEARAAELVAAQRAQFDALRAATLREKKHANKLQSKLQVLHGGYEQLQRTLLRELHELHYQLQQARIELACFQAMRSAEQRALHQRLERLQGEVAYLAQLEAEQQMRYSNLLTERENLREVLKFGL